MPIEFLKRMVASTLGNMSPSQECQDCARNLLVNTKVSNLPNTTKSRPLTILKDNCTVEQALSVLAQHRLISAPVVSSAEQQGNPDAIPEVATVGASEATEILGFVDIRDLLTSFLAEVDIPALANVKLLQRMRMLEQLGSQFGRKRLKDLKFMGTDGDFLHASQARSTLFELVLNGLLQPRSTAETGGHVVHRVALFDNDGTITQIISQSDIIRFLARNKDSLGPVSAAPVQELGLVQSQVESVSPETPAIEALAVMSKKRLSSLAVVDPDGVILGNFSMSDMRTIMSEHFGALALPVGEFLAHEHHTEYVGFNRLHEEGILGTPAHKFVADHVGRRRPRTPGRELGQSLVLAQPSTTLGEVMELLVQNAIHRVYVVDGHRHPIGIITATDILRALLHVAT